MIGFGTSMKYSHTNWSVVTRKKSSEVSIAFITSTVHHLIVVTGIGWANLAVDFTTRHLTRFRPIALSQFTS